MTKLAKNKMFKSKRFVAFIISLVIFILMLILTDYPPVDISMSITMIVTVYIGGDTLRGSVYNDEKVNDEEVG